MATSATLHTAACSITAAELDSASNRVITEKYYNAQEDLTPELDYLDDEIEEIGELSDSMSSHFSTSRPTTPSQPIISRQTSPNIEPFSLAHKAERILGLCHGTLPHAQACLENARDEVRRTSDEGGMKARMNRARRAMSVSGKVQGIEKGEEEERKDRRKRATEGVVHWQKEVTRLQAEDSVSGKR